MNLTERKLIGKIALLGAGLTLGVLLVGLLGWLDPLERMLYDSRAQTCQFFRPRPTHQLVHLDIDDPSLETMGRWPWPHSWLAKIIDELRVAGAKAVALDVVLSEPQRTEYEPRRSEVAFKPEQGVAEGRFDVVEDDQVFAQALQKMGRSLVPLTFNLSSPRSPRGEEMLAQLKADLSLPFEELEPRLLQKGLPRTGSLEEEHDRFLRARHEAAFERVLAELSRQEVDFEQLKRTILPPREAFYTESPLARLLRTEYDRVQSLLSLRRFARPRPQELPPVMPVDLSLAPTRLLSQATGASGYVYYKPDADGVVRAIPLWTDHGGFLYPQLGLALACMMLDIEPREIRLEADRMIIPRPGGRDIVVPVRREYISEWRRNATMFFDIPWFGKGSWEYMYDPRQQVPRQHLPVVKVWHIHELLERLIINNRSIDDALEFALAYLNSPQLESFRHARPPIEDPTERLALLEATAREMESMDLLTAFEGLSETDLARAEEEADKTLAALQQRVGQGQPTPQQQEELDQAERQQDKARAEHKLFGTIQAMHRLPKETRDLARDLVAARSELRAMVEGRAVLMGWTATAAVADFVPTSLHAKCPGAMVHGVIFNAIMTGEFWKRAPAWIAPVLTVILGLLATAAVALLSPLTAAGAALMLALGYMVLNGIVLFDYGNILIDAAPPLTAIVLAASGATVYRSFVEIRERRRITRRFQNYVDPALVNYVLEHPDQAGLDGQVKELTVVFTDLAGFTAISERLKEKTVAILNDYLKLMVPLIKNNKGLVNKFLGDGIMFFYGAPEENADHALAAVATVLKMQQVLPEFNRGLEAQGLPPVKMRAGISTGAMIVGDAGGADRSDYTVLGDTVNLGARLETANKAVGALTLISQRTAELVGDLFLLRPIGRLVVVGKTEGVMTYEPLAYAAQATEAQKTLVQLTRAVVEAYQAARFQECLAAAARLEAQLGSSHLTELYGELCRQYLLQPPGPDFRGQVVLSEK